MGFDTKVVWHYFSGMKKVTIVGAGYEDCNDADFQPHRINNLIFAAVPRISTKLGVFTTKREEFDR